MKRVFLFFFFSRFSIFPTFFLFLTRVSRCPCPCDPPPLKKKKLPFEFRAVISAFCPFTLPEYLVRHSWPETAEPCILVYRA